MLMRLVSSDLYDPVQETQDSLLGVGKERPFKNGLSVSNYSRVDGIKLSIS